MTGYKTYAMAIGIGIAAFMKSMGWLSEDQYTVAAGILGALALVFLRMALKTMGIPCDEAAEVSKDAKDESRTNMGRGLTDHS